MNIASARSAIANANSARAFAQRNDDYLPAIDQFTVERQIHGHCASLDAKSIDDASGRFTIEPRYAHGKPGRNCQHQEDASYQLFPDFANCQAGLHV